MNQKLIKKKVRKWQRILFLHRWTLYGEIVKGNRARVSYDMEYFMAIIKVGKSIPKNLLDETICHELLHLIMAENLKEEALIEVLTKIIMKEWG